MSQEVWETDGLLVRPRAVAELWAIVERAQGPAEAALAMGGYVIK